MKKKKLIIAILVLLLVAGVFWRQTRRADAPKGKFNGQSGQGINKSQYSLDNPASIWVVVNKKRPLSPLDYAPAGLIDIGGGQLLRREAAEMLAQLLNAAVQNGLSLKALSGYRSFAAQKDIYSNEVAGFGLEFANLESAKPGYSEHQTGLAIDVGGGGCGIEDCFGHTKEGKWVAANAYKFGYIVRYVAGKETITGYRAEPWHIRYVGAELASELNRSGVQTLEEFFGLPAAPGY